MLEIIGEMPKNIGEKREINTVCRAKGVKQIFRIGIHQSCCLGKLADGVVTKTPGCAKRLSSDE